MADADDVRRLALALPGVAEIESDGFDFRVSPAISTVGRSALDTSTALTPT